MICPTCGAKTRVLETRDGDTERVRRVRHCPNSHIFQTLEALDVKISPYGPSNTVGASAPAPGPNTPL